jgi:hypothetical protein
MEENLGFFIGGNGLMNENVLRSFTLSVTFDLSGTPFKITSAVHFLECIGPVLR